MVIKLLPIYSSMAPLLLDNDQLYSQTESRLGEALVLRFDHVQDLC